MLFQDFGHCCFADFTLREIMAAFGGFAPSPLAGEGWGEGVMVMGGKVALQTTVPLTLALSRKGRGDASSLARIKKNQLNRT